MNKTILITGATDGIGLLTAQTLAQRGHTVLIHGRNADKLDLAAQTIGTDIQTYRTDLSSLDETRDMAQRILADHTHLDVLMNNAGVLKTPHPTLANGQDVRFVVNTIAPYILTNLLLPIIPSDGRILNLSSAAQAPIDIAALNGERSLDDMASYAQSKLAITIWSQVMAAERTDGPCVIAVNPGSLLATKMVKKGFGVAGHDLRIGSDILCRLALEGEYQNASGKYWDNDAGAFAAPHPSALDPQHVDAVMNAIITQTAAPVS
ncbi:MAG: SDR family NAD(P)-dependent oxidoreductase [Pseudomonadota bacterium]